MFTGILSSRAALMGAVAFGGLVGIPDALAAPTQPEDGGVGVSRPVARGAVAATRSGVRRRQAGQPGRSLREINPRVAPAVIAPLPRPVPVGPLAPIGTALEANGVNLHLLLIDAYFNNFDMGVTKGVSSNTNLVIMGADFDLAKIAGIEGGSVHFLEALLTLRRSINNTASSYADVTAGWEPIFPYSTNQLSVLTYEQTLMDGALTVEFGRSNPNRAFNLPVQGNLTSNWNNVWYQSAGARVPLQGTWMARAAYKLSPQWYVGAGAYEDNPRAAIQNGTVWDASTSTGALALAQIGYKTDYATAALPERYELLGFYNSSDRTNPSVSALGRSLVFNAGDPTITRSGSAGFILNAQKALWRADGGADLKNLTPTALVGFASVSAAPYGIVPVTADVSGGLILQAPDQSRPYDSYGFKFHWTQLSQSYQNFLIDANLISGGTGYFKSRNSFVYELNSHWQLTPEISIDPTIQYFQNANNYYNPFTPKVSQDGFYFGATLVVGLGKILGLSSGF